MSDSESALYKRLLSITLLLGLIVFFWGLGNIALMSLNEARRALPAQDMFHGGDWLLPHLNGELYLTKPPLIYWLSASTAYLFGSVNEWAARLPSALAAAITVWMVYRYARREFGAWPALFSAQLLIANVTFAMFARRAEIEMLLTLLCAGALLAAIHYIRGGADKRWIYFSYLLLALAMLTKGPLVLLFVTLPLLIVAFYQKDSRCWEVLRSPLGWTIFVLFGLSWYVYVTWRLGPDIWSAIAHRDMVEKIQGEASAKPLFSYLGWILLDFMPAIMLLLIRPASIWQRCKERSDYMILLTGILIPLLIFSLFNNKHAKYLLPAYPFMALLLAMRLGEFFDAVRPRVRQVILFLGLLLPAMYGIYYGVAEARIYHYRVSVFPKLMAWSREPQPAPLYAYGELDSRVVYYSSKPVKVLNRADYLELRKANQPMLLLVENASLDEMKPEAGCVVKEFRPYLKKDKTLTVLGFGRACPASISAEPS